VAACDPAWPAPAFRISSGTYVCTDSLCPAFDYGPVDTSGRTVSFNITNVGDTRANQFAQSLLGSQVPGNFSLVADTCGNSLLPGGISCTLSVKFQPGASDAAGTEYGGQSSLANLRLTAGKTPTLQAILQGTKAAPVTDGPIDSTTLDAGYGGVLPHHRIVSRHNGDAMAVWIQQGGEPRQEVFSSMYSASAGLWSPPEIVDSNANPLGYLGLDTDGSQFHLTWHRFEGPITKIQYSANAGAGWSPKTLVSNSGVHSVQPVIASHSSGKTTAAWLTGQGIFMRRFDGTWGPIEAVNSTPCASPGNERIVVNGDTDPTFTVAWTCSGGEVKARQYTWDASPGFDGPDVVLDTTTNSVGGLELAGNADGDLMAVWHQNDAPYNVASARFVPGDGWHAPILVDTDNMSAGTRPNLVVDSDGTATVIYKQDDSTTSFVVTDLFARRSVPDGGNFSFEPSTVKIDAHDLGSAQPLIDNFQPVQVAVDANNTVFVSWTQADATGKNSVFLNTFRDSVWEGSLEIDTDSVPYGAVFPSLDVQPDGTLTAIWAQSDGVSYSIHADHPLASTSVVAIPEPSSIALLAGGLFFRNTRHRRSRSLSAADPLANRSGDRRP
jgi:hypothetical protein